jgi:hypothetical protein
MRIGDKVCTMRFVNANGRFRNEDFNHLSDEFVGAPTEEGLDAITGEFNSAVCINSDDRVRG